MGVDVSAMTYVGKWVDNAEAYLIEKGFLKEDQLHEEFDGDLGELYPKYVPIQCQEVSYYSDQGAYVGFEVSPSEYKLFDELIARFKELTGDDAEVCSFSHWW